MLVFTTLGFNKLTSTTNTITSKLTITETMLNIKNIFDKFAEFVDNLTNCKISKTTINTSKIKAQQIAIHSHKNTLSFFNL